MSSLTENLQTIYGIKQEIKEAIGTSSDIFSDYPAYISAMAGGITPTGYAYVTSNGDYDVSTYAMVNVEVSGGEGLDWDDVATAGYIIPAGTFNIAANGSSIDVASYAYANVAVPIPAGYIQPSGTITIDDNYNYTTVDVTSYAYADVQISGSSGPVKGIDSHVFVSVRPGLSGNSNYPYFSPYETEDGAEQYIQNDYLVPFNDTYDASVNVHTLISDSFTAFGLDPNDFVSTIKKFEAYDWNSGDPTALYDLTCTTMLQEGNSNYECWCLVEGTLQSATDVCFKNDNGSWDDMDSQWSMDNNWTLMECMPVVEKYQDEYSPYGWSTSSTNDGTYISLPAGPVKLYLHYMESDGSTCDVYYQVYDSLNYQWTPKWYRMADTAAMTFVNPNA